MNETEIKQMIEQIGYQEFYRYFQEKTKLITNLQEENRSLRNNYNDNEQAIHKIMMENQKLNKIIDELEKWLNEEIIVNKTNQIEVPNYPEWYIKWNCYLNILNKLTDLKKRWNKWNINIL